MPLATAAVLLLLALLACRPPDDDTGEDEVVYPRLVAGPDDGRQHIVDRMLGPVGYDDLVGAHGPSISFLV